MPERRRGSRAVGVLLALGLGVLGPLAGAPAAQADEAAVTRTDLTFAGTPEPDGRPVTLDATILESTGGPPRPAVVLNHGFGGDKTDTFAIGTELARQGYVVLAYTSRGFGASGGKIHLVDPAYEGQDARRAVDLLATRPEVAQQAGDPVVGFAGASYGGAVSLVAAAVDPRVDAVVPAFTWSSLTSALFPQSAVTAAPRGPADVAAVPGPGVFKQRWASLFFRSGGGGAGGGLCGRFSPALCAGYQQAARTGTPPASLVAALDRTSPRSVAPGVHAPTLLVQGESDTLFGLDQAEATARALPAATVKRIVWSAGGHDAGIDLQEFLPSLTDWFGRYLRHDGSPVATTFRYDVPRTSLVGNGGGDGDGPQTRQLPFYPGLAGPFVTRPLSLAGTEQEVISPAGGSPAALTSLPGTGSALGGLASVGGYALGVLPGQSEGGVEIRHRGPLLKLETPYNPRSCPSRSPSRGPACREGLHNRPGSGGRL